MKRTVFICLVLAFACGQTSAISSTTAARERTVRDGGAAANSAQSGESRGPTAVHYRVRLLRAEPIRAAFVRLIELQGASSERMAELRPFVDRDFGDYIVVTISLDGNDRKHMIPLQQALTSGEAATVKGNDISRTKGRHASPSFTIPAAESGWTRGQIRSAAHG